jgi:ferric-dicitrate binding protein FerR (iron transport regulator)
MSENIYTKLIVKELKGEATQEESLMINEWMNENHENQQIYHDLWRAYMFTSPDVDLFIPDKEAVWSKIINKISIPGPKRESWVIQLTKIAAVALIFFLIGMAVQYFLTKNISPEFLNQYSTMIVPEGQKSMIVLSDGSSIWLNSGSTLKYQNSFNSQIREVEIEGEAYFEVKEDKTRMFRVKSGAAYVEVYGTAFNVKNYKEEKKLEVTVENGNVGVMKDGHRLADLTKGKQVIINEETNEIRLNSVAVDVVTAWKNDELIFEGTPFEEVIRYLERWYGVNITIEEKMKKKHNYTFKVKTETLRELLKLLKVITPLQYTIDGKNVTIRYAN